MAARPSTGAPLRGPLSAANHDTRGPNGHKRSICALFQVHLAGMRVPVGQGHSTPLGAPSQQSRCLAEAEIAVDSAWFGQRQDVCWQQEFSHLITAIGGCPQRVTRPNTRLNTRLGDITWPTAPHDPSFT